MPEYTPEQKARVRARIDEPFKGRRAHSNKFQRAAGVLANVADDFEGAQRDLISQVVQLLEERGSGS